MPGFELSTAVVAKHRGGQVMALSADAVGRFFVLGAERLRSYDVVPQGRAVVRAGAGFELKAPPPSDDDDDDPDSTATSTDRSAEDGAGVALVSIRGPLEQRSEAWACGVSDGYDAIADRHGLALLDRRVGALVLVIGSPGGDAAGLFEGVRRMVAMSAAAGKSVLCYVDEEAGSAAACLALCVSDGVYVPPAGRIGSIGCFAVHTDESAALEAEGLKLTVISDLPGKVAAHPSAPLSDLGRARIQERVTELGDRFRATVAEARGVSVESLVALNAAMLNADDAVAAGLADGVASLEDVLSLAFARADAYRASLAAPPLVVPAATAPFATTPAPGAPMPMSRALRAAAGAAADASDATVEAAITAKLTAAARILALVDGGAADPSMAEGKIRAALLDAPRYASLLETQETEKKVSESAERVSLTASLVGRLTPPDVWVDGPQGPQVGQPKEPYASMEIGALRSLSKSLTGNPLAKLASPSTKAPADAVVGGDADLVGTLSEDEVRFCASTGRDPLGFAKAKAQSAIKPLPAGPVGGSSWT